MAAWERLRDLEFVVDGIRAERRAVDVSTQFTRVTTTYVLSGGGTEGQGEDVTYDATEHDRMKIMGGGGSWTLADFSAACEAMNFRDYLRWAWESAALDLALRQNGLSLGSALERPYAPVRFVVSTRGDAFAWLAAAPELELKLDPESGWELGFMERLAETSRVRVLDLKAYYKGTAVDVVPDPELYRTVAELFPDVVLEDAWLEGECGDVVRPHAARLSFDAPIHSADDVRKLPVEPGWMNIKPSRFGTVARLLECIEHCEARGIRLYGGGQFELGVGRRQIQALASLFYADGPNDVAPSEYNTGEPRPGLPASPLPAPRGIGF